MESEETFGRKMTAIPYWGPILAILFVVGDRFAAPIIKATFGRRPWIEATTESPPVTMLWQATGRSDSGTAVDEIADAFERGETRPNPLYSRWVGYERGAARLAPKGP